MAERSVVTEANTVGIPARARFAWRIISGGQTGVDRAGLDAALAAGLAIGGWCPRGRRAEDGVIPEQYIMREAQTDRYPERTRLNVRDADLTLIFTDGALEGGSALTAELAHKLHRPLLVLDLAALSVTAAAARLRTWVAEHPTARVLNVAGPRLSQAPEIPALVRQVLHDVFIEWRAAGDTAAGDPAPAPWPPERPQTGVLPGLDG